MNEESYPTRLDIMLVEKGMDIRDSKGMAAGSVKKIDILRKEFDSPVRPGGAILVGDMNIPSVFFRGWDILDEVWVFDFQIALDPQEDPVTFEDCVLWLIDKGFTSINPEGWGGIDRKGQLKEEGIKFVE